MNVFVSVNVHGELLTELHFQHTTQNLQLKMSCDKVWSTVSTALNFPASRIKNQSTSVKEQIPNTAHNCLRIKRFARRTCSSRETIVLFCYVLDNTFSPTSLFQCYLVRNRAVTSSS
ncbi:hypothetical protein QR680_002156 [Steinernema hermaphroditum]|uniref:Uncharacterized protein n=1 Tax=Steinernema hermaphroditum TaxID=289476 RepID=A0AA39H1J1_9BILA|nr:hypothetical protein QR680_002156 [Steinernema hermaphroditum]